MMQSGSDQRRQQLLQIAFELQAEHEAGEERKLSEAAFREAALEAGLDPQLLARAEEELARRERVAAEAAGRGRRRRRLAAVAVLGVLALGAAGLGLARVLFPPPPAPWVETFDVPGRWALDRNPDTRATLSWQEEPGRGQVAVVRVDAFAPEQDGAYHVNLDGVLAPDDASRYSDLVVDLKGSLPTARVYLEAGEAGSDERWRSPAIAVQRDWTTHRLPLRSFERQERRNGDWRTVSWSAPEGVSQLSVKLGHYMNPPDAAGELFVDALRFESP